MRNRKLKVWIFWVAVLCHFGLFGSMMANAQMLNQPLPPYEAMFQLVENAIESPAVDLVFSANGEVVKVISGACIGCERRVFMPAKNIGVKVGRNVVKPTPALNGRPATVIYRIDSEVVTSVNFFELDAEESYEN